MYVFSVLINMKKKKKKKKKQLRVSVELVTLLSANHFH